MSCGLLVRTFNTQYAVCPACPTARSLSHSAVLASQAAPGSVCRHGGKRDQIHALAMELVKSDGDCSVIQLHYSKQHGKNSQRNSYTRFTMASNTKCTYSLNSL